MPLPLLKDSHMSPLKTKSSEEQVALVDFDFHSPKGSKGSWSLLPEASKSNGEHAQQEIDRMDGMDRMCQACPEVVAALRAAGIPMPHSQFTHVEPMSTWQRLAVSVV